MVIVADWRYVVSCHSVSKMYANDLIYNICDKTTHDNQMKAQWQSAYAHSASRHERTVHSDSKHVDSGVGASNGCIASQGLILISPITLIISGFNNLAVSHCARTIPLWFLLSFYRALLIHSFVHSIVHCSLAWTLFIEFLHSCCGSLFRPLQRLLP